MNRTEHLLIILAEECAEVAQRATKALRFSLKEIQPEQPLTNADRILYEFNDLFAVIKMLEAEGVFNGASVLHYPSINLKIAKVERYLNYSSEVGTLIDDRTHFCDQCKMHVTDKEARDCKNPDCLPF